MTIYHPEKTAMIVVDPFNDFLSEGGKLFSFAKENFEAVDLVEKIGSILTTARKHRFKVVYAPHHYTTKDDYLNWKFLAPSHQGTKSNKVFEKGSWGAEFHLDLVPKEGDLIAQNHWTASGFANTDLDFILRMHGIENIVIMGMRANTCIDSTARYGVELGYHVTLIKDGIGAFSHEEIRATVETNFPNYGHTLLSSQEFVKSISEG